MSIESPNKVTWATLVRDLLFSCGLGFYWINQRVGNEKIFLEIFKERIYDIYRQNWRMDLDNTSDGRLYKYIKEEFEFEVYLNINNSSLRIATSKIRLSSHLFLIERGRWGRNRLQREERKCVVCGTIEDEFHVLVECGRFSNERKGCLTAELKRRRSMFEFVNFFKNKNETIQRKLALLCLRTQKKYKDLM